MTDSAPDPAPARRLRLSRARAAEIGRFTVISAVSAAVTLGTPVVLHTVFGVDPRWAVAAAFVFAFFVNFVLVRRYVFRSTGRASGEILRFAASSAVFRGAEYLGFLALFHAGMTYWIAQALVVGVSFVVKFVTMRWFVFRRPAADAVP